MNTVHAQFVGDKALLSQEELRRLLDLARRAEEIDLRIESEDVPTLGLMGWHNLGFALILLSARM